MVYLLGLLTRLTALDLSFNKIDGSIPSELGESWLHDMKGIMYGR